MTPMQNLIEFIKRQANETTSLDVKRALLGTITVINATCIEPEKQMIIDAYDKCDYNHNHLLIENQIDGEQYYNETFKQ